MNNEKRAIDYAPLSLAYIGDGVYELYVRSRIIKEHPDLPAHKLHKAAIKYVSAEAQSRSVEAMMEYLTEAETAQFKRGRNAKSPTSAKNASIVEYRRATGFEALIGFLYINKSNERLEELMAIAFENAKKE